MCDTFFENFRPPPLIRLFDDITQHPSPFCVLCEMALKFFQKLCLKQFWRQKHFYASHLKMSRDNLAHPLSSPCNIKWHCPAPTSGEGPKVVSFKILWEK